jgi:hypothetical protein
MDSSGNKFIQSASLSSSLASKDFTNTGPLGVNLVFEYL